MLTSEEYSKVVSVLNREPNKAELAILEAMWSEHCSYKSSKRWFHLFKVTSPRLFLGIGEGAGLLDVGDDLLVGLGLESHNHPSAIDPYNGAATGIGGIIRDILSQGCRPVALLDSLHFGSLHSLHSQHLFENVVRGIAFYGNCCGIPTLAGEVEFDSSFEKNCLVNAMCIGTVRKDKVVRSIASVPGHFFLLYGSKTGRDGIHGVSFASKDLKEDSNKDRPAVQIGDPLMEKILIDATLELTEQNLLAGLQDLGGGGLSCAISEMCYRGKTGAIIRLEDVPLREEGMEPWEILVSESQERMMAIVSPQNLERVLTILRKYDLSYAVLGEVSDNSHFIVYYKGNEVVNLPVDLIVAGFPIPKRESRIPDYIKRLGSYSDLSLPLANDLTSEILKLLSSSNIGDKSWVYQQYDQHVQTQTVFSAGYDSAVIRLENGKFLALTLDSNSYMTKLDPYNGAANSAAEAMRNIVAVGAEPVALVDCLNYGNPEKADSYWQFVESVKGLGQFSRDFQLPVVGGNVSFYNESKQNGKRERINPTPAVGIVGLIDDIKHLTPSSFQNRNSAILIIGDTEKGLGGSEYLRNNHNTNVLPIPQYSRDKELKARDAVLKLNRAGLLLSCHDISHGGFITALIEMTFEKFTGAEIDLSRLPSSEKLTTEEQLFNEAGGRYIVEIEPNNIESARSLLDKVSVSYAFIGSTTQSSSLVIKDVLETTLKTLYEHWNGTIRKYMEV